MEEEKQNSTEGQEAAPPPPPPPEYPAPKTSGMAIASLVLGTLGFLTCVTAPVGLVLGIVAMVQIGRTPERLRGMGLAVAGTVISGVAILIVPIFAAILFPVFVRARVTAHKTLCLSNARQLCTAMQLYASDHDGKYPEAAKWNDALLRYCPKASRVDVLVCPAAKDRNPSYAMNAQLSGFPKSEVKMRASTIMIFDSIPGRNQAGGPELLPSPPRHGRSHVVGFTDGRAKAVPAFQVDSLNWDPRSTTPPEPKDWEERPSGG